MRLAPTLVFLACAAFACAKEEPEEEVLGDSPAANSGGSTTSKKKRPAFDAKFGDAGPEDEAPARPVVCTDKDDPGPSENVAKTLPEVDDCGDAYHEARGLISTSLDVDYFKLTTKDKMWCNVEADIELQSPGVELCVFMRCRDASRDPVQGCEEGELKKNELGMQGCCTSGAGRATPKWDCHGLTDDDSTDVYFRLKSLGGEQCRAYNVRYRF